MASKIDAINELRNARKKQEEEKNKTARQTTQSAAASRISTIEELREKRAQQNKATSERVNNITKSRTSQATQQKTTPTSANKTQSAWANARGDILKSVANRVGSTSVGKSVSEGTQNSVGAKAPINPVEEYISNANKNIDAKIAERKAELESMGSRSVSLGGNTDMYIKKEMRDGKIIGTPVFAASDPEFDKRYKELEKEIALLEREKNKNAKTLRWNAYKNDMQSEDFEEYAKMGAYIANPAAEDVSKTTEFLGGLFKWRGYDDDAYDAAQNKVAFVRNNWDKLNSTTQSVLTSEGQDLYRYLEEDEANLYYSYLAKEQEGLIPAGSADAFLEFMKDDLNSRKGTKKGASDFEDIYDDPGIIRGARTAKYAYDTAVDRFVSDKIDYFGKLTGLKDDVSPTSVQQYAGQYVRNNSGPFSKVAYDVGDTAGYMAIPMLETVGVGGLAKMAGATPKLAGTLSSFTMGASIGTSAAGGAYKQALAEGYSEDEAWMYGNAVGASEAILQSLLGAVGGKLPNKLMAKAASINNTVGRFGAMLAINNLGELAEEELQLIIEPAIKSAVFDVDYEGPKLEEYLYTALITSLSTAMYSAPHAAANALGVELPQNYLEDPEVKTAVDEVKNDREKLDSLIESAKGFGEDTKAGQAATRIEQAVQEENEISDDDVAELLVENSRERSNELRKQRDAEVESVLGDETRVEELLQKSYDLGGKASTVAERIASKVNNGKEVTSKDIQRLMEANETVASDNAKTAMKTLQEAVTRKVTGYGEYGSKAFTEVMSTSDGQSVTDITLEFDTPYQAGLVNQNPDNLNLDTDLKVKAYRAGLLDYNAQHKIDKAHKPGVIYSEESSIVEWKNAPSDITQEEKNLAEALVKGLGTRMDFSSAEEAFNAFYDPDTGKTTFDAGFGISPALTKKLGSLDYLKKVEKLASERGHSFTFYLAHEIAVHRAMDLAPTEMRAFVNAMYTYKQSKSSGANLARAKKVSYLAHGEDIDISTAFEEVVADSILDLYDGDAKAFSDAIYSIINGTDTNAQKGARTFLEWLSDTIERFKAWAKNLTGKAKASAERDISEMENLRNMFEQAIAKSVNTVKQARKSGNTARVTTASDGTVTITNKNGEPIAMMQKDGSSQFSMKTWDESGRDTLVTWLDNRVKEKKLTKEEAADIVKQMDEFYEICSEFIDKYSPFGAWSNAEVVKGKNGKPAFSVVKANGDYAMNLDFSLVCKKRRTLDAVFGEMIKRGIMDDVVLEEADIVRINDVIRESGFETACALCFVDSKRYRQAMVADNFVNKYNELVEMLIPEGSDVSAHYFNYVGKAKDNVGKGLHRLSDSAVADGIKKLKKVMRDNGAKTVPHKIAKHLLAHPEDRKFVRRSDFMNTDGFEEVSINNPNVMKLYNSSKGSGGPKAAFSDVQYLGDILSKNNFTPERAYAVGGVRIQSFSDYIPRLVFDYLQMIGDLSAKKLPAHAYTKEALFAMQFGMTGIKVNMSLVPAIVEGGVAPGLDANGDYVWFDGQSFGSDVNVKGSAKTGFDLAVKIQNANGYSANCGTIAVGISDQHILKMLNDPNIRMIIPYHKSSLNHIVAVMNNIDKYENYTGVQNTRYADTGTKIDTKKTKDFNYNEALRRTGDAKAAAEEYKAWCAKNNFLPKFDKFAWHENYYKLLEDFSTYDNGVAAPQGPVTMTFPKEGDAFGSMAQLIEQGLEEDAVLEGKREKNLPKIVDEIEGALKKKFSFKGDTTAQKNTTTESGVKWSLKKVRELTETDVRGLLEGCINGEYGDHSYIPLKKNTPSILIDKVNEHSKGTVQVNDLPIAMEVGKARQAMEESEFESDGDTRYHGIDVDGMIAIINGMDDPEYIVFQENGRYVEVVSYYDKRKHRVWAVLDFGDFKYADLMNGFEGGNYNILVTAFEPDSFEQYISSNNNEIVYDKKKDYHQSGSRGLSPSHLRGQSFEDSVPPSEPNVKKNQKSSLKGEAETFEEIVRIREEGAKAGKSASEIQQEVDEYVNDVRAENERASTQYSRDASDTRMYPERWTADRVGDKDKTPMSLSDIVAKIRHDFDLNITTGHIRGKGVRGQYNLRDKGIRTRVANNLPTIAHELGHALDDRYSITKDLAKELKDELSNGMDAGFRSQYKKSQWVSEGYAEFVRKFLQNRETTAIDYPEFTKHFLNSMSGKDAALIETLADEINAYYSLDADSATSAIKFREEGTTDFRTIGEKIKEKANVLYQEWVDSNRGIKMFDDATGTSTYKLASNAAYADAIAGQVIIGALTDANGRYVAPGLKTALHGLNLKDKNEYRLFGEYLTVKHGPERLAEGQRIFADDRKNSSAFMERRQAELEEQFPHFAEISDRLYEFEREFLQTWGVRTGLVSADAAESWGERWKFYVPLNRAVSMDNRGMGAKRGFANQNSTIKKAHGSGLDIVHPVDNIINNIVKMVNAGVRNNVMRSITDAAQKFDANALFIEKIPTPMTRQGFDMSGVKDNLIELLEGSNLSKAGKKEAAQAVLSLDDILYQYGKGKAHGDVITVLKNGEQEFWKVNDAMLLSSITNMSQNSRGGILDAYAVVSRIITTNITGNNVIWALFSNFPRDLQTFFVYSKEKNPFKAFAAMASAYVNAVKGDNADPLYKEYLAMGGGKTSMYTAERNLAKRAREKFKGKNITLNPLDWLDFVNNTIEAGPRYATYKMMRESGLNPQEAFYEAMDITVNFRRGGKTSRDVNKIVPFFNASVQGLDKFRRWITASDVHTSDRKKVVRGRMIAFFAVSAALGALTYGANNGDDEAEKNYEQLSNYTKNSFWCFPMGDGKYFAIPKPRELGVLSSFFETSLEYGIGKNDRAFDGFHEYVIDNAMPTLASDVAQGDWRGAIGDLGIVGIGANMMANRDFLGRPIVSASMQNLEPKDQYTDRTSKIAYWVGQAFNWSPTMVDYFFNSTLGGWHKAQKALFPVGGENVDFTLGVQNTYVKDNQYSNDLTNWLYDKAEQSKKASNSDPNNLAKSIEKSMDSKMASFYSNYNKLSKNLSETTSSRATRQTVLNMILEYQKASDNGYITKAQSIVYSICKKEGSTELLPSSVNTYVKDGDDKTRNLSAAQYVEYQLDYNRRYWEYVEDNITTSQSHAEKLAVLKAAKQTAGDAATDQVLARIGAPKTKFSTKFNGVNYNDIVTFRAEIDLADDDGINQKEVEDIIDDMLRYGLDKHDAYTLFHSRYESDKNNPWRQYK